MSISRSLCTTACSLVTVLLLGCFTPPWLTAQGVAISHAFAESSPNFFWPVPAIARKNGPAIVGISNMSAGLYDQDEEQGTGSGVIIDAAQGYVVTNYHVVEGAKTLQVSLSDGRTVAGRLLGSDARSDLAVVQIPASGLTAATLGNSGTMEVGELVVAIGNPLGDEFARTVTHGIVSAVDRLLEIDEVRLKVIQIDAPINPGNSGGGLFNVRGELIGINSAKVSLPGVEGMGFAIPIDTARPIIQQLIEQGSVQRPWLGIEGFTVSALVSEYYGLPQGVLVRRVTPDSPAAQAGVRRGDIITGINEKTITSIATLTEELAKRQVGDPVSVTLFRKGQTATVSAVLANLPPELR
ncbi:S1C family serine protease [Heliophilum fasciatum]|uniref:Serine protease Do n=1 Tax=Heliophilum fasciatum TaxID=35700 RepID=A0A4R2RE59_9FIRM|nr:trypsin-like peptidase domain-containing protein [Heliophilum fasciatum]MCW2278970.1 serine protease Do [Heliophilum fasciatum]TCP61780.1 serine protease Do [Heliophilum fasciatum]